MPKRTCQTAAWIVVLALLSGLPASCAKSQPEKTYKNIPESDWLKRANDTDWGTREVAYEALANLDRMDIVTRALDAEPREHRLSIAAMIVFYGKDSRARAAGITALGEAIHGKAEFHNEFWILATHADEAKWLVGRMRNAIDSSEYDRDKWEMLLRAMGDEP